MSAPMAAGVAAHHPTLKALAETQSPLIRSTEFANCSDSRQPTSKRHDDLAEMLVGFHVLERLADVVEGKHLVDRQLQFARFHCAPDVLADFVEDLADFLYRAGTKGDADIIDAARRVQVEVEIGMGAAEPAHIDDAALDPGGGEILA